MRIYLLGYMGCGKSTVGKKLAAKLGYIFKDLDSYIEEQESRSIPAIFEEQGEAVFRSMEHERLKELSQKENVVIACGGGTPCFNNNLEIINTTGISFYLYMEPGALVNRLWNAKVNRPLVGNKSREELLVFVREHLKSREVFYQQAHHRVNHMALGERIKELMALL